MDPAPAAAPHQLSDAQRRVVEHSAGTLLVIGAAATGKTEALSRRLARIASDRDEPGGALVVTRSHAAAASIRARAEAAIAGAYEELWAGTFQEVAERLLRDYAVEAGLDPLFEPVGAADRLAMLLDRIDRLPLRRHEIRGNPAGLLARLLQRIDALKEAGVSATDLAAQAKERERAAAGEAELEAARREAEFVSLYLEHDRILREAGSLDSGDLVAELTRLLRVRADVRDRLGQRFPHLIVDEYEDAGAARRAMLAALAEIGGSAVIACDYDQSIAVPDGGPGGGVEELRERHPDAVEVRLEECFRCGDDAVDAARAVIAPVAERAADRGWRSAAPETAVRFWRCESERAEAQAVAREVEHLIAANEVRPEMVAVVVASLEGEGRAVAAAFEERGVPFHLEGPAAFFRRPEVRDVMAWLRVLADPNDAAAAVRALTRPPIELRSVDLARCTTIARRRKLDMVSALDAALESPQLPPEARDRLNAFLRLHRAATPALEELRADVFVRRLIERVGLRRHRLFAAHPEAAERLLSLSRLADLADAWARREPGAPTRDFVRYLTAVAEAGVPSEDAPPRPAPPRVRVIEPRQAKGLEFDHVYLLGLNRRLAGARSPAVPVTPGAEPGGAAADVEAARRRLAYAAITRARRAVVLSWTESVREGAGQPAQLYEDARAVLDASEEVHAEELFGPAEGLQAAYRMARDEMLEASWKVGGSLGELRLDTYMDVNRAVARFLELLKLAALVQRPADQAAAEALESLNELLRSVATPEQRAELERSTLDAYLLAEESERTRRRELVASREEPSLEAFIPRRGGGLGLSASDVELYRTCPLKYKFARVFAIPQEQTINQRFGILIHQVLERFHAEEGRGAGEGESLDRLLALFEAGWRRAGFAASDDELQFRDRAVAALTRYHERHRSSPTSPVWLERGFAFRLGPHQLRGRVDRVDRLADGAYELIDYKTGVPKTAAELADDVQLAIYRLGAREAWQIEADAQSYYYVLDDRKVAVQSSPDDLERVERTVLDVGAGIMGQDFEPRPSYEVCSWCDYRLICPAAET